MSIEVLKEKVKYYLGDDMFTFSGMIYDDLTTQILIKIVDDYARLRQKIVSAFTENEEFENRIADGVINKINDHVAKENLTKTVLKTKH